MPRKVSPESLRIGSFLPWRSRWFSEKEYAKLAAEDEGIRRFLRARLSDAGLERIEIERSGAKVKIIVTVSKPGLVIGRGGGGIGVLRDDLSGKVSGQLDINVQEVKNPSLSAPILAARVARLLERRGRRYRYILNEIADEVMARGAQGVGIEIAGRIGGREVARRENFKRGSVPHSTLRADIDFARDTAHTRYGTIGVKVWVHRGESEGS
ncbi:MAG: 30S ribosomal protein S3 [Patescibacteria group bacterium]|nr:MAG: 30S ribosomal protein S3 [Patescibacteria group bacterium]